MNWPKDFSPHACVSGLTQKFTVDAIERRITVKIVNKTCINV